MNRIIRICRPLPALLLLILSTIAALPAGAQPKLPGAWSREMTTDGQTVTQVLLFAGNYFSWTQHRSSDGAFHWTRGGSWKQDGKTLTLTYEFHTTDSTQVGKTASLSLSGNKKRLTLAGGDGKSQWQPLDAGVQTPLTGAWLFSGRKGDDGQITRRSTDGPRKTMKLLTGTRFQWIAFNTATGQFFGTGGGAYSAENGAYTENIGFFSRDDKRVGASLRFDFSVDGADWHHSGLNSSGQPLYEVWSRRQ